MSFAYEPRPITLECIERDGRRSTRVVGEWPDVTKFAQRLLEIDTGSLIAIDGDLLTITVENGRATYRLEPMDDPYRTVRVAHKVSSMLEFS